MATNENANAGTVTAGSGGTPGNQAGTGSGSGSNPASPGGPDIGHGVSPRPLVPVGPGPVVNGGGTNGGSGGDGDAGSLCDQLPCLLKAICSMTTLLHKVVDACYPPSTWPTDSYPDGCGNGCGGGDCGCHDSKKDKEPNPASPTSKDGDDSGTGKGDDHH